MYQLTSYMPSIGATNTQNDNSYSEKYYFSTMPECNQMTYQIFNDWNLHHFLLLTLVIGQSKLTIATWLKFDTRATTDVANIAVFALWWELKDISFWYHEIGRSAQKNGLLHLFYKRYVTAGNRCLVRFYKGTTQYQEVYDRTGSSTEVFAIHSEQQT